MVRMGEFAIFGGVDDEAQGDEENTEIEKNAGKVQNSHLRG